MPLRHHLNLLLISSILKQKLRFLTLSTLFWSLWNFKTHYLLAFLYSFLNFAGHRCFFLFLPLFLFLVAFLSLLKPLLQNLNTLERFNLSMQAFRALFFLFIFFILAVLVIHYLLFLLYYTLILAVHIFLFFLSFLAVFESFLVSFLRTDFLE